tara:strand:+ start:3698 stop:4294 length:597 start_codon:yes stop_codon:yes gene_type:complete
MFKNRRAKGGMNMNFNLTTNSQNSAIIVNRNTDIKHLTTHLPQPSLEKPRNIWGKPIWQFIHSICEKVKEDTFTEIKDGLIDILKQICTNLPCPDCSMHSTSYLSSLSNQQIRTKNDLKMYFFYFHNDVNKRTGKKEESVNILELYESSILNNMYNNFIFHFKEQYHSVKLISENLYRLRVAKVIEDWFKSHNKYFNY